MKISATSSLKFSDCFMVNNEDAIGIPDDVFTTKFGCKRTIRFPYEKGIGHMDESIRFLSSKVVVTDSSC